MPCAPPLPRSNYCDHRFANSALTGSAHSGGAAVTPTWLVWSPMPPECLEKISCSSMLDAGRAWAERQFKKGLLPRGAKEVLGRAKNDAPPRHSTYRLKITLVNT